MSDSPLPPLTWETFWSTWHLDVLWLVVTLALGASYAACVVAGRRRGHRTLRGWRIGMYAAGLVLLLLTTSSAIHGYAMALFSMHMVEHLMLIMVVPALLVAGQPLTALSRAARNPDRVVRVLRSAPVALLTHPVTGLLAYTAVIVGTHLSGFMDAMAMNPTLMTLEQVLYLVSGYLLLLPLLGQEPIRWNVPYFFRLALLMGAMVPDTIVGIVLMQNESNPFPMMFSMRPGWATPAMEDLHRAGAIMWGVGDTLMMGMSLCLVLTIISGYHRDNLLGGWLEGARRSTFQDHVTKGSSEPAARPGEQDTRDLDDDDAALEAYNRMLARLDRDSRR